MIRLFIIIVLCFQLISIYSFVTVNPLRLKCSAGIVKRSLSFLDTTDFPITSALITSSAALLTIQLASYWKLQLTAAEVFGGIPVNSIVVELDAQDGKNVFYLPKGVAYTAVMKSDDSDPVKAKEKRSRNEQMILECIGKANGGGLQLTGKVRNRSKEIPASSADCIISYNALKRTTNKLDTVTEAFRILRPGGLFIFVEPDKEDILNSVCTVFPKSVTRTPISQRVINQLDASYSTSTNIGGGSTVKSSQQKEMKKAKKTKLNTKNQNVQSFAANNAVEDNDDRSDINDQSNIDSNMENNAVDFGVDNRIEDNKNSAKRQAIVKPGIQLQKIGNFFDPILVGIALKP